MKKVLALSLVLSTLLMSSFSLFEPAISVASSASDSSTIITLNVDEGIAITDAPDTSMSQHLSMSNNTAIASTTWNVKTNAVAGYTLKIHATGVSSGGTTAYVVAGAGDSSFNGTYEASGTFSGRTYYKITGQNKFMVSDGSKWYLNNALETTTTAGALEWSVATASNQAWGPNPVTTGVTSTTDGATNTATLAALGASYEAATYCSTLSDGGHDDWYLPAKDQLYAGWLDQGIVGFPDATYLSSTEHSAAYAWYLDTLAEQVDPFDKDLQLYSVRCARSSTGSGPSYESPVSVNPSISSWPAVNAGTGTAPVTSTVIGGGFTGRAMTSASSSIPDFATSAATWSSLAASSAAFGFSVIGSDAITGTYGTASDCGTGHTANTSLNYRGFSGDTDVNVSTRTSTTTPSGIDSTVCYAVEQKGIYVPSGVYTATVVATAVTQ